MDVINLNDHFVAQYRELEQELDRLREQCAQPPAAALADDRTPQLQQQLLEAQQQLAEAQSRCALEQQAMATLEFERRDLQAQVQRLQKEVQTLRDDRGNDEDAQRRLAVAEEEISHWRNECGRLKKEIDEHRPERWTSSTQTAETEALRREVEQLRELTSRLPDNFRQNPAVVLAQLVRLEELETENQRLKQDNFNLGFENHRLKQKKPTG